MMYRFVLALTRITIAGFLCLGTFAALAEEPKEDGLHIAPQLLATALREFSEQTGLQVGYASEIAEGKSTDGVEGIDKPTLALERLLASSGLKHTFVNDQTVVIQVAAAEISDGGGDSGSGNGVTPGAVMMAQATTESVERNADSGQIEDDQSSSLKEAEDLKLEEIVVVGSRLGSTPLDSALPIRVLDREQINRSGASTVAQALSLLPEVSVGNAGDTRGTRAGFNNEHASTNSTTVQLRGLPLGTTLVLINGRRVGSSATFASFASQSFFDLSNIPLSLVDRIEVLPYGSSAVYGGDGLGGVVNIVLKRDAQGLEVRLRQGGASGYDETQASVTWGRASSRGSLTAAASYEKRGTLATRERSLTADGDFTRFGGRDLRAPAHANPGTVSSREGCPPPPAFCFVPLEQRGNLPGLDSPFAAIPTGHNGQGLTPADFVGTTGLQNRGLLDTRFFSASETVSLTLQGRYALASQLELFGSLLYTRRDVPPGEVPLSLLGAADGRFIVPATNPFNPFGVEVGVDVTQFSTGVFFDYQPEQLVPNLGLRGELGEWTWELAGSLSKDLTDVIRVGQDHDAIQAALASPDPATALNPFRGDGGSLGSPELIDSLFTREPRRNLGSDLWQVNGFVRGPLARLPAGRVEALLGAEWERQKLELIRAPDDPESTSNVSGADESSSIFAEVRLPLFSRRGVFSDAPSGQSAGQRRQAGELLALTGAFRADESDRFEETGTTETVGLELRPASSLLFRATYSSAFKPLSHYSAFVATSEFNSPIVPVTDPRMGDENVLVDMIFGGGVPPDLNPETSTSRTLGLVWTPRTLAGLNLSLTAWENRLRDRISNLGAQFIVDNEDLFPGRVIRDPVTGVIQQVDIRQGNIALTNIEGVDFAASWRWSTRYGDFSPTLAATWVGQYEEQITLESPLEDRLGVRTTSSAWSPRWKGTTTLGWSYDDQVHAMLTGRYVSAYKDGRPLDTGPEAGTFQSLGDFWLFDLTVDLGIGQWLAPEKRRLSDTRLSIGAVNLFNKLPDFCNVCGAFGFAFAYDASQYDIRGRFAYVDLRLSF